MAMEIRGLRHDELEEHSDLVHQSYLEYALSGERPFLADRHWWLNSVIRDPYFDPDLTRVMFDGGRMVASVTNFDRWLHVADGRRARVSCIGSVCTHPDYRRRGLVKQVLAESVEWMLRQGFHWSFLFGKEEVYGGSGWTVLSTLSATADLRLRPGLADGLTVRPVTADDAPELVRLYDGFCSRLTGPIERNETYWRQRVLPGRWGDPTSYQLVLRGEAAIGYFWADGDRISEIAWSQCGSEVLAAALRHVDGPARFTFSSADLIRELGGASTVTRAAEVTGGITLAETYRGLWRYIGPGAGEFPEITGTDTMKRFLRRQDYAFWPTDSF